MIKKGLAGLAATLALHGIAQAAGASAAASATPAAPASTWAAQGQLGLVVTRSTTNTDSGNASFDLAHSMGRWTLAGGLAGVYASTNSTTTQQDLNVHLQADLELTQRLFWFNTARWDRNLFSGFAYQESVATGAGFNLIQTHATQLSAELGIGDRRQEPEILTTNALGGVTSRLRQPVVNDAVVQAAVKFQHQITPSTNILNTVLVQAGSSDTLTTDNLALQVKVDASLSLAVGMQLVNNTNPPTGGNVKHTDTVMTVNLVYTLKNAKLSPTGATSTAVSDLNLP